MVEVHAPTYIACLTPPGTGAIATLALRGPRAWGLVRQQFRPLAAGQALPEEPATGQFWLGRLGESLTDQVVLSVQRVGPEAWVELHCHGGREVVRLFLEMFTALGAHLCTWQELESRTTDEPLQALAAAALAEARTFRTAAILLDQHQGALGQALEAVLSALEQDDLDRAGRLLRELSRWSSVGRHLTRPWRVAVAGAPNVGKSSLVNALAGYQRSVVAATPGTTRDVVTTLLAVEGWPIELADTAGLRDEAGDLEGQGIRQAQRTAQSADLCLWVLDASTPPTWPNFSPPALQLVVNKIDLPAAWNLDTATGAVRVSARTGTGLAELCACVAQHLVPEASPRGAAVPFTESLGEQIEEAERLLGAGRRHEAESLLRVTRASRLEPRGSTKI